MPTIARVDGIAIKMYYREHPPPHFHAEHGADVAVFSIAPVRIIAGSLTPADERKVVRWAADRQAALALNWVKCQSGLAPDKL